MWWCWKRPARQQRRSAWFRFKEWLPVLILGLPLLAFGYWFLATRVEEHRQLQPPPHVQTLDKFAAAWTEPRHLSLCEHRGETFIVWVGEQSQTGMSGPSLYLFDRRGRLVDWTWQVGEGGSLDAFYPDCWHHPRLTVKEAVRWAAENRQNMP